MNYCKCTCENPTCSCTPQEVTAFKDCNGKLFATKGEAMVSEITYQVKHKINGTENYGPYQLVKNWEIEKVVKALAELNLLKID